MKYGKINCGGQQVLNSRRMQALWGDKRHVVANVLREKIKDTFCISLCTASCLSHRSFVQGLIILILQTIFVGRFLCAYVKQCCNFTAGAFLVMWHDMTCCRKDSFLGEGFLSVWNYCDTANTVTTTFNFCDRLLRPFVCKGFMSLVMV
jgi:hypothetical protein